MKRPMKLTAVVVLFLALAGTAGFAQSLAVGTVKPAIDGVVKAGEYSYSQQFDSLTLYASRTADTLSLAVVGKGKTRGGFGNCIACRCLFAFARTCA